MEKFQYGDATSKEYFGVIIKWRITRAYNALNNKINQNYLIFNLQKNYLALDKKNKDKFTLFIKHLL